MRERSGCWFDPGLERTQRAHSTERIGGKGHRVLRLHDVPGSDTVRAKL